MAVSTPSLVLRQVFSDGVDKSGTQTEGDRTLNQETELLKRITVRADIFGGKPIIRGMRIAVEHVLANLAAGQTVEDILKDYPFLEPEDIRACLLYAHRSLAGEHVHDRISVR